MGANYLSIPKQTLQRLPTYYQYLTTLRQRGLDTISSPVIAKALGWSDILVRKDLAWVSAKGGRPRTGFEIDELLDNLRRCLGYYNINDAVLVGVGQLGRALLNYRGFEQYGIHIIAAFDTAPALRGDCGGTPVFEADRLPGLCRRLGVRIGVIAVPAQAAQAVCDTMVESGLLAIWNFAPVSLRAPAPILIQNESMAASLAQIRIQLKNERGGGAV